MSQRLRDRLTNDPPKFHYWNDAWRVGGFDKITLGLLEDAIESRRVPVDATVFETGAGLSSAWLLGLGVTLHSFFLSSDLGELIQAFLVDEHVPTDRWSRHVGPSELTLPSHVAGLAREEAHLCLIDGGHGLQTVMTDFVYFNYALQPEGVLVIDDMQLGSSRLLYEMLTQNRSYRPIRSTPKTAFLEKVTTQRLLPDWGSQSEFLEGVLAGLPRRTIQSDP